MDAVHTYEYEMLLPYDAVPSKGHYILAQWHGTPDPTVLKDRSGCIAKLSYGDLHKLCSRSSCKGGEICLTAAKNKKKQE